MKREPITDDTAKLVADAAAALAKKFGKGAIAILGDPGSYPEIKQVVPTGIDAFDEIIGVGGIPLGKLVELYGPESSGKTTIAKYILAQAQHHSGLITAYLDTEQSGVAKYDEQLGVQKGKSLLSQPTTLEEAFAQMEAIIEHIRTARASGLILFDSVAATPVQSELDRGYDENAPPGERARFLAVALKKLVGQLRDVNVGLVFVNQEREKIGAMPYQEQTYSPGGRAFRHWCHVRLRIHRTSWLKDKDQQIGIVSEIKVVKNKLAPPNKAVRVKIEWATGRISKAD